MAIAVQTEHRVLDFSQPYGDDNGLYFVVCGPTMPTELQVFSAQWRCSGVELAGFLSVSCRHPLGDRDIIKSKNVLDPIGRQPPLQQFNKK
ncbi:hypothetical protein OUZ56_016789 [Daphnia magna]|uniref:Uncharacterized protein n=1 Tax=Daphnia magna TaxID=35525 RepID=A0ABR0ARJ2_9CRUS|nr:hypothetical protein OUZ56_016789 [Daphnia magna]